MKKILSIFLLSIFLFNTAGYYFAFKVVQWQTKVDMKTYIQSGQFNSQLTVISIDKSELKDLERIDEKEIKYKNQFYDIVFSKQTCTSVIYYCINDKQEENLFSYLNDHIKTHVSDKPLKNESGKKISENVVKLYFFNEKIEYPQFLIKSNNGFTPYYLNYNSFQLSTSTPPPEFA